MCWLLWYCLHNSVVYILLILFVVLFCKIFIFVYLLGLLFACVLGLWVIYVVLCFRKWCCLCCKLFCFWLIFVVAYDLVGSFVVLVLDVNCLLVFEWVGCCLLIMNWFCILFECYLRLFVLSFWFCCLHCVYLICLVSYNAYLC